MAGIKNTSSDYGIPPKLEHGWVIYISPEYKYVWYVSGEMSFVMFTVFLCSMHYITRRVLHQNNNDPTFIHFPLSQSGQVSWLNTLWASSDGNTSATCVVRCEVNLMGVENVIKVGSALT